MIKIRVLNLKWIVPFDLSFFFNFFNTRIIFLELLIFIYIYIYFSVLHTTRKIV